MPLSPKDYLGFAPGDDRKLATWTEITGYFKKLCEDAKRIKWFSMGTSTEGRPFYYLVISSPDNLADLDRYRKIQSRLADPRSLDEDQAQVLIDQGKTIVLITCSIHATEVGAAQMSMQLAYNLETEDGQEVKKILDDVIVILVPSLNPDGLDLVVDWYKDHLGTPYEGTSPPFLYQKYAGHDNNRDWFMLNLTETSLTVKHIHNVWHPHIVYDLHQMGERGFRLFLPPYLDPYDPNVDYILRQQTAELGLHMMGEVLSSGKTGVSCHNVYDAYSPSRAYQHYHGGVRILSEMASVRIASPINIGQDDLRPTRDGLDPREISWNHPSPWPGGKWRLKDIVEYELVACMACLSHASSFRSLWMSNFYKLSKRACDRDTPFAFVIPHDQKDPGMLSELLDVLHKGQVEIHRASHDFEANGCTFNAGDYVIRLSQPYGSYAKTLLEIQVYPDLRQYPGGPPKLPYDVTGHTLPLLMGVKTYLVETEFEAVLEKVDMPVRLSGGVVQKKGSAKWIAIPASVNSSAKVVNRLLDLGKEVLRTAVGYRDEGSFVPAGTFLVNTDNIDLVEELGHTYGVRASTLDSIKSPLTKLNKSKVGVYKSYRPTADEGWLRYVLEEYEFPLESVTNEVVRNRGIDEFNILIIPSQDASIISNGVSRGLLPPRYTGGWGQEGKDAVSSFIESGGTCVFLGNATEWAITNLGLPCRDVVKDRSSQEFFAPGSILKTIVDTEHPLGFGLQRETSVMFLRSPAWELTQGLAGEIVARYPSVDPLQSGWLLGGNLLADKAAMASFQVGLGRVILIGFHPHFRAQARATYKFIFNSIYLSGATNI
jgi:hypothetical protein